MSLVSYVKTNWVSKITALSPTNLNKIEEGVDNVTTEVITHEADFIRQPGYGVTTGGTTAYLITLSPVPSALVDGMGISAKINATNTGAATINPNGLGAKTIKNPDGTDMIAGDLQAGGIYSLKYNSTTTNFILVGKGGGPNKAGSNTVFTVSTVDQAITKGYYPGNLIDGKVKGEANLTAGNIKSGVVIGAVTGNLLSLPTTVTAGYNTFYVASGGEVYDGAGEIKNDVIVTIGGTYRTQFDMRSGSAGYGCWGQIYVNGVARGTSQYTTLATDTTYTQDITVNAGDHIQLRGQAAAMKSSVCENFKLMINELIGYTVISG